MTLGHAPSEPKGRQRRVRNVAIAHRPSPKGVATTAALLLVIFGAFVVIGFLAAAHGQVFNWDSASVLATAVATMGLATITAGLARSTARDVEATARLARLAEEEQEVRDRATLIVTGVAYGIGDSVAAPAVTVAGITLVNIGLAPAAFITLEIEGLSESGQRIFYGSSDNSNFLHAGAERRVDIPLTHEPDPPTPAETKVSGVYLQRNHLRRRDPRAVDQKAKRPEWELNGRFEWKVNERTRQTFVKYPNDDPEELTNPRVPDNAGPLRAEA